MTEYERWHAMKLDDPDLTEELNAIEGNPEEINDRFYRELEFGTGGLRGVIGAGTNRINIYTVRKATQGLANYLNKKTSHASVAIAGKNGQFRADAVLQAVPLQGGGSFLVGAIAEATIAAAGGNNTMVLAVYLLNGFRIRQILKEIVGAVVQPVHIILVAVICFAHVGVDTAAGFANCLCPVIACVVGILSRYTVQNGSFPFTANQGSV